MDCGDWLKNILPNVKYNNRDNWLNYIQSMKKNHKFEYKDIGNKMKTQDNLRKLNGKNNLYFAGSYFGNGFHEDAVRSAFQAYNDFTKKGN